ncbi:MAG: hypothetical protein IT364_24785 [Candidatus Hydrogenedentes bacterium]|nr:hypothetical protein [Candidatus Hydrogenedentota bacterium]
MPRDDRILNAISYIVVFALGAAAGGAFGFYAAARLTFRSRIYGVDKDLVYTLAIPATFVVVGALLGGMAAVAFAAQSQWEPTLHLTRDRKKEKKQ